MCSWAPCAQFRQKVLRHGKVMCKVPCWMCCTSVVISMLLLDRCARASRSGSRAALDASPTSMTMSPIRPAASPPPLGARPVPPWPPCLPQNPRLALRRCEAVLALRAHPGRPRSPRALMRFQKSVPWRLSRRRWRRRRRRERPQRRRTSGTRAQARTRSRGVAAAGAAGGASSSRAFRVRVCRVKSRLYTLGLQIKPTPTGAASKSLEGTLDIICFSWACCLAERLSPDTQQA